MMEVRIWRYTDVLQELGRISFCLSDLAIINTYLLLVGIEIE